MHLSGIFIFVDIIRFYDIYYPSHTENRSKKLNFLYKSWLDFCKSFANSHLRCSNSAKTLNKNLRQYLRKFVFSPTIYQCEMSISHKIIIKCCGIFKYWKKWDVVANCVSDRRVGCSRSSQQRVAKWQCCSHSSQQRGRSFVWLLTQFAATGSLFGKAAHEVRSNGLAVLQCYLWSSQ